MYKYIYLTEVYVRLCQLYLPFHACAHTKLFVFKMLHYLLHLDVLCFGVFLWHWSKVKSSLVKNYKIYTYKYV